jgi:hypothetical protein
MALAAGVCAWADGDWAGGWWMLGGAVWTA